MDTQTHTSADQANAALLAAAQAMLKAVKDMSRAPDVDFSLPVFTPVTKAHADLTDAVIQSAAMAAIAKSQR